MRRVFGDRPQIDYTSIIIRRAMLFLFDKAQNVSCMLGCVASYYSSIEAGREKLKIRDVDAKEAMGLRTSNGQMS